MGQCELGLSSALRALVERADALSGDDLYKASISKNRVVGLKKLITDLGAEMLDADKGASKIIRNNVRKKIITELNNIQASVENVEFVKTVLKDATITNKHDVKKVLANIYKRTVNNVNGDVEKLNRRIDLEFDDIYKRNIDEKDIKRAKYVYNKHLEDGKTLVKELKKDLNTEDMTEIQREIFDALKTGNSSKSKSLNITAKVFKKVDKYIEEELISRGIDFDSLKNHVIAASEEASTLRHLGYDKYREMLLRTTDFDTVFGKKMKANDPEIEVWMADRFDRATDAGVGKSLFSPEVKKINVRREIAFLDDAAEFEFLTTVKRKNTDFVMDAFAHRQRVLRDSRITEMHGTDLSDIADTIGNTVKNDKQVLSILGDDVDKIVDANNKQQIRKAGIARGSSGSVGDATQTFIDVVSDLSSAAWTGLSGLRNLMYDGTFHPAWVAHIQNDSSFIKEYMGAWGRMVSLSTTKNKRVQMTNLLQDQGIAAIISTHHMNKGVLGIEEELRAKASKTLAAKAGRSVGKWSGGDRLFNAQVVGENFETMAVINRALNLDWDEIKGDHVLKNLFAESGINKKQFDAFKDAKRLQWEGKDYMIDVDSLDASGQGGLQTSKQAASKLKAAYLNLHANLLNDRAARTTLDGTVSNTIDFDSPWTVLFHKFYGIGLSQNRANLKYTRLHEGLSSAGGDLKGLYDVGKTAKGAAFLAKYMMASVSAGMLYLWSRDLVHLRHPRDITPGAMLEAGLVGGVGGIYAFAGNDLMFNGDVISTPLAAPIKVGKDIVRSVGSKRGDPVKSAVKGVARITPGANLWFLAGAKEAAMRKAFGRSGYERRRDKKKGNPPLTERK